MHERPARRNARSDDVEEAPERKRRREDHGSCCDVHLTRDRRPTETALGGVSREPREETKRRLSDPRRVARMRELAAQQPGHRLEDTRRAQRPDAESAASYSSGRSARMDADASFAETSAS